MSTNTPRICPFRPITILGNQEPSVFPAAFYFDSNIALAFTFFFFAGKILKNFCPFTVWSRNSQPGPFSLSIKIFYGKSDPSPALFRSGAPFLPEIPAIFPGTWLRKSRLFCSICPIYGHYFQIWSPSCPIFPAHSMLMSRLGRRFPIPKSLYRKTRHFPYSAPIYREYVLWYNQPVPERRDLYDRPFRVL